MRYVVYKLSELFENIKRLCEKQFKIIRFIREVESYRALQAKYTQQVVTVYHARCEMGPEAWFQVLKRIKEKPTMDAIMKDLDADKNI
jgi:hypothetical protein